MEQTVYHIKIHFVALTIIASTLILIFGLSMSGNYTIQLEHAFVPIIVSLSIIILSFFLGSWIGMARAKIILTEKGIDHIWERRFIFSREENISIPWEIVDNYVFEHFSHFNSFTINFNTNKRYKFYRMNLFSMNDDFNKFLTDFPKLSNEYRDALRSGCGLKPVNEGAGIYNYKYIRWFFLFLFALMAILFLIEFMRK